MSEQQNLEIVRRGYEAFGRGDIDALLELLDENVEWVSPGPPDMPTAGRHHGREAVRAFFGAINETFEIQQFAPGTFVAQGDHVVVLGKDVARVKATDKVITEPWAHAFELRNGKIVRFQEYLDTSASVTELRAAHART